jgi:hypothetical protein
MENTKKKCSQCGLVNFATEMECRRCGGFLLRPAADPSDGKTRSPFSFALVALACALVAAGGLWYWSGGTKRSEPASDTQYIPQTRIAPTPTPPAAGPLTVDPHDTRAVEKMIAPVDNQRVEQLREQQQKAVEDLGNKVPKPFAQGPPE